MKRCRYCCCCGYGYFHQQNYFTIIIKSTLIIIIIKNILFPSNCFTSYHDDQKIDRNKKIAVPIVRAARRTPSSAVSVLMIALRSIVSSMGASGLAEPFILS